MTGNFTAGYVTKRPKHRHRNPRTQVLTAELLTMANRAKQPRYPSTEKWRDKSMHRWINICPCVCYFPDGKVLRAKFLGQRAGKRSKLPCIPLNCGGLFSYNFPTKTLFQTAPTAARNLPRRKGVVGLWVGAFEPYGVFSGALVFSSPLKQFLCYSWQPKNKQNHRVPFLVQFLEGFLCPLYIQQYVKVTIIRHNSGLWEINTT